MNYYILDLILVMPGSMRRLMAGALKALEQMDEYMIAQWNSRVKRWGSCIHLRRSECFSQGEEVNQILHRLEGQENTVNRKS